MSDKVFSYLVGELSTEQKKNVKIVNVKKITKVNLTVKIGTRIKQ